MLNRKIHKLVSILKQPFKRPFYGFVRGHSELTEDQIAEVKSCLLKDDADITLQFERKFASLVGDGDCVSYASGRMGFYALMRLLNIGNGDEVILPGATCSVMVNSVLRVGATPIFSDIDPNNFGSCPLGIEKCVSPRTKLMVAQHSFGIPCDIEAIKDLAHLHGIFLLEDCALTLGSKSNGVVVGNYGDAALFSTDHSKPLNTLIGGMIYSRNRDLVRKLLDEQLLYAHLSSKKQSALWRRVLIERFVCTPSRQGLMGLIDLASKVLHSMPSLESPFLTDDSCSTPGARYPYPAKLPSFLALLGLMQANRWSEEAHLRKETLRKLLKITATSSIRSLVSPAYYNPHLDIVPLRFVWVANQPDERNKFGNYIDISWTWFREPIVATKEPLSNFGYRDGSCPVSEYVGSRIINVPCNVPSDHVSGLVKRFSETINC